MLKFLRALSVFAGTIIGVGIFGLPYVASRAGFFIVVLYFLFIAGVAIVLHLMYGRVSSEAETLHRLPGYAEQYLGVSWKKVALLITGLGLTGALLAYLIIGGEFLNSSLSPYLGGNPLTYTLLFFCLGAFLIFRGIKSISQIEFVLLITFFVILIVFFIKAMPFINTSYLMNMDLKFLALPYGVILFSLWGLPLIPEVKEILGKDSKALKKVVISGILLAAVTYLFFIFIIVGTSGVNTSKEAISGLAGTLGYNIIKLGFIFGIITCFTSFITLGLTLKKVLWYDFKVPKNLSWFIVCFLPLTLFLLGFREFINIISLTGAFALGCEAILVVFIYRSFLKKKFSQRMNPFLYLLPVFFVLGIFIEVFYFIFSK